MALVLVWGTASTESSVAYLAEHEAYILRIWVRVPTLPGKPGKMRVRLKNLEISWNFENFNKYHEKMI